MFKEVTLTLLWASCDLYSENSPLLGSHKLNLCTDRTLLPSQPTPVYEFPGAAVPKYEKLGGWSSRNTPLAGPEASSVRLRWGRAVLPVRILAKALFHAAPQGL